jgi:hypothetical protein
MTREIRNVDAFADSSLSVGEGVGTRAFASVSSPSCDSWRRAITLSRTGVRDPSDYSSDPVVGLDRWLTLGLVLLELLTKELKSSPARICCSKRPASSPGLPCNALKSFSNACRRNLRAALLDWPTCDS